MRAIARQKLSAPSAWRLSCLGRRCTPATGTPGSSFGIAGYLAPAHSAVSRRPLASRTAVPPCPSGWRWSALTLPLSPLCAQPSRPAVETGVSGGKKALEARCFFTGSGLDVPASESGACAISATGCRAGPSPRRLRSGSPVFCLCVPGRFDVRNARRGVEGVPVQPARSPGRFWCFQPCS